MWEGPLLPLIPQETCRGISQSFIIFAKKPLKNFNTEKCAFFMGNMHRELGKKYLLNLRLFCSRRRLLLTFFRVQREFFSPKPTESPTIELPKRGEFANSFAKKFFLYKTAKCTGFYLCNKCRISPCNRPLFSKVQGKIR